MKLLEIIGLSIVFGGATAFVRKIWNILWEEMTRKLTKQEELEMEIEEEEDGDTL